MKLILFDTALAEPYLERRGAKVVTSFFFAYKLYYAAKLYANNQAFSKVGA